MTKIMPFLFLPILVFAKAVSDFEGVYVNKHSVNIVSENKTVKNVEDVVRIQTVNDKKANIMVETFNQNFHSCQLIGEAELQGEVLVFKSSISKKMNRGKAATCVLKISQTKNESGDKTLKIEDEHENCKLRYCGMAAGLGGEFKQKTISVQEKN